MDARAAVDVTIIGNDALGTFTTPPFTNMRTLGLEVRFWLPSATFTPTINGLIKTKIDRKVDENLPVTARDVAL